MEKYITKTGIQYELRGEQYYSSLSPINAEACSRFTEFRLSATVAATVVVMVAVPVADGSSDGSRR
jgi:hypothetical protein